LKTLLITALLLSGNTYAEYMSTTYNWNIEHKEILKDSNTYIPDIISLFTKDDVYVYHDTDIFGYSHKRTAIKELIPVNSDN